MLTNDITKPIELNRKMRCISMRSIYRAQKASGENFLPFMRFSANSTTLPINDDEVLSVS